MKLLSLFSAAAIANPMLPLLLMDDMEDDSMKMIMMMNTMVRSYTVNGYKRY